MTSDQSLAGRLFGAALVMLVCSVFFQLGPRLAAGGVPEAGATAFSSMTVPASESPTAEDGIVILVRTKLVQGASDAKTPVIAGLTVQSGNANPPRSSLRAKESTDGDYLLEVLDQDGTTIYSMHFQYPRTLMAPLPLDGVPESGQIDRVEIQNPEAALVIPYLSDALTIRVSPPGGPPAASMSMNKAAWSELVPVETNLGVPSQPGKFHLLLIASGYTSAEMPAFVSRANEIKTKILSLKPFSDYTAKIEVHAYQNTASLGCACGCFAIDRLMCCDGAGVVSAAAASGYYYDEIIVIHNTSTYCGGGYRDLGSYQSDSYSSYAMIYDGSWSKSMAPHEFGHSFGNLCDEYSYGTEGYAYYDCVNCRALCSDWEDLTTACTQGCDAKPDYFRPDPSVMLSLDYGTYNKPSIYNSLTPRLKYFTESPVATGSLTVSLSPAQAVALGARWRVDGGDWQNSGAVVSNLAAGSHAVEYYQSVAGYDPPVNESLTVTADQTTSLSRTYTVATTGRLQVNLAPTEAVSTGAAWNVDAGAWNASGAVLSGLSPGQHTVSFKGISNWTAPPDQAATITAGQTTSLAGNYAPLLAADFTGTPTEGKAGLKVTFTDASRGAIKTWRWDFGDNTSSSQKNPKHAYKKAGTYTVSLTVTGSFPGAGSNTLTRNGYITIYPPPTPAFSANPATGMAPLDVAFTDESQGAVTGWAWSFGDKKTSAEQNPHHTYEKAGSYTVKLTVKGPEGTSVKSKTKYIKVSKAAQ